MSYDRKAAKLKPVLTSAFEKELLDMKSELKKR